MKRNLLNASMTVLLLVVMNYRFTENAVHEVVGVLLGVLFFLHNQWNQGWYRSLGKDKMTSRRLLMDAVNAFLLVAMGVALITGLWISQTLLAPLALRPRLAVHDIHIVSAYLAFLLTAVHLGLHWEMLQQRVCRWRGIVYPSAAYRRYGRVAALLVMGYGVYASFEQNIGSRLLMEHINTFWGVEPSLIGFTLDYAAIFGVYAAGAHYAQQCLKHIAQRHAVRRGGSVCNLPEEQGKEGI